MLQGLFLQARVAFCQNALIENTGHRFLSHPLYIDDDLRTGSCGRVAGGVVALSFGCTYDADSDVL